MTSQQSFIDKQIEQIQNELGEVSKYLELTDARTIGHGMSPDEYAQAAAKSEVPFATTHTTSAKELYVSTSIYLDRWEFYFGYGNNDKSINAIVIKRRHLSKLSAERFIEQMCLILKLALAGQLYARVGYSGDTATWSELLLDLGRDQRVLDLHRLAKTDQKSSTSSKLVKNQLTKPVALPKDLILLKPNWQIRDTLRRIEFNHRRRRLAIGGVLISGPAVLASIVIGNLTGQTGFFWLATGLAAVLVVSAVAMSIKAAWVFLVTLLAGAIATLIGAVGPLALMYFVVEPRISPETYDSLMPAVATFSVIAAIVLAVIVTTRMKAWLDPSVKL